MSIKLSVCVDMIYADLPFAERMHNVAKLGFPAYEFWRLDDKDLDVILAKQRSLGLACAAFVGCGRVPLVDSARRDDLMVTFREALAQAARFGCQRLLMTTGQEMIGVPRQDQRDSIVEGLREAAKPAEDLGVALVLEPLNILVDHKGYFLSSSSEAFAILDEVGSPAVKLLYDVYHQQITEGNLITTITANVTRIGHIHVADVPGRHEPGSGEINYRSVFEAIDSAGYEGYVGLEYKPSKDPADTLRSVKALAEI